MWGPGGIAFTSSDGRGRTEIWLADSSGENPRRLSSTSGHVLELEAWLPEGLLGRFESRYASERAWVVDPTTGHMRRLPTGYFTGIDWSRDGRSILMNLGCDGLFEMESGQVAIVPAAGGPVRIVADGPCEASWNR